MNAKFVNCFALALTAAAVLAACGGSSDDGAGSLTAFSVTPTSLKVTAAGGCPTGDIGRILVNGGTAPYDLYGPISMSFQSVDPATNLATGTRIIKLGNENTQFAVITDGTWCYEDASVSVKDRHGREAVVKVTAAASA